MSRKTQVKEMTYITGLRKNYFLVLRWRRAAYYPTMTLYQFLLFNATLKVLGKRGSFTFPSATKNFSRRWERVGRYAWKAYARMSSLTPSGSSFDTFSSDCLEITSNCDVTYDRSCDFQTWKAWHRIMIMRFESGKQMRYNFLSLSKPRHCP